MDGKSLLAFFGNSKNQKFRPITEYPRIDTIDRSINCNHFKTQHEGFKSSGSKVTTFEKFIKSGQMIQRMKNRLFGPKMKMKDIDIIRLPIECGMFYVLICGAESF